MSKVNKRSYKFGDPLINVSVVALSLLGIVMVGSASIGSVSTYGLNYAVLNMFKHFAFIITGATCAFFMLALFKVKYINEKSLKYCFVILLFLMCLCRLWGTNGSYAWIPIPNPFFSITLQPAEFMKILMVVLLSYIFTVSVDSFKVTGKFRNEKKKELYYKERLKVCVGYPFALVSLILFTGIYIQRDTGSTLILLLMCLTVFFATSSKFYINYKISMCIIIIIFIIGCSMFLQPYQVERFLTWSNPLYDPLDSSYQLLNSLIAFSNGGLTGLGLGSSTQKYGYIPECHNDFIGAILYEELGIIGLLLVAIPTLIIINRLLFHSSRMPNQTMKLILIGISSYFFIHFFVNLGGVSGMIPMTGVPLLLVSSGGSSILAAMLSIGLAQVIIKQYR